MKKRFILAGLLFFLLITGSVSQVSATVTRGDTLFNEAYTKGQVLINEIDRTTQYYFIFLQYIEAFTQETTDIDDAVHSEVQSDVYSVSGVLLLRSVTKDEAVRKLPAGIYVIGKTKVRLP